MDWNKIETENQLINLHRENDLKQRVYVCACMCVCVLVLT